MLRNVLLILRVCACAPLLAQFAPQAGIPGSTAIHRDSSIIKAWAIGYHVLRGWQNTLDTTLGKATAGNEESIPGKAGNGIISLGDGGVAVLHVYHPVKNGPGFDFVLFENGFIDQSLDTGAAYLELAFVEVSSDGIHFFRFPSSSYTDTISQLGPFGAIRAEKINNLAGKYISPFGTPFNLDEVPDDSLLNKDAVTHIRVVDAVGSLHDSFCTRDAAGHKINDPWPTPFPSSGFDLDALGIIHQNTAITYSPTHRTPDFSLYPNPARENDVVSIRAAFKAPVVSIKVTDVSGKEHMEHSDWPTAQITGLHAGIYFIHVTTVAGTTVKRLVISE